MNHKWKTHQNPPATQARVLREQFSREIPLPIRVVTPRRKPDGIMLHETTTQEPARSK